MDEFFMLPIQLPSDIIYLLCHCHYLTPSSDRSPAQSARSRVDPPSSTFSLTCVPSVFLDHIRTRPGSPDALASHSLHHPFEDSRLDMNHWLPRYGIPFLFVPSTIPSNSVCSVIRAAFRYNSLQYSPVRMPSPFGPLLTTAQMRHRKRLLPGIRLHPYILNLKRNFPVLCSMSAPRQPKVYRSEIAQQFWSETLEPAHSKRQGSDGAQSRTA
ncbi:hypothetical protein F5148DRAFT_387428 [Russula earlei]|uniref:Uncharacterized protein n=1 Tax=Russula earlei TaxID=71964 RepID=A0ACC0U081_9AGAM|nr:hypothetical protein F5148DRAFT_387428 [Russula earlei]